MSYDDFDVIVYKVLKYVYGCLKAGKPADMSRAWELAGSPPDEYWHVVLNSMLDDGLLIGVEVYEDYSGTMVLAAHPAVTREGAVYVREDSNMRKVATFLGAAFDKALEAAVKATVG